MALVRVKTKYQVTLPSALREEVGLDVGDVLEARVERGRITLTPKALIDRRILEGLQDIEKGREYGPYSSVAEAMAAFKARTARAVKRTRRVAS